MLINSRKLLLEYRAKGACLPAFNICNPDIYEAVKISLLLAIVRSNVL